MMTHYNTPINKRVFLCLFLLSFTAFAQNKKPVALDSGAIKIQFEAVEKESNNYQDYKVIKKTWLNHLQSNVLDTLNAHQKDKSEAKALISQQEKEISKLKNQLQEVQDSLQLTINDKNSISLLGIATEKSSYKTIMWSLVAVLILGLLFFLFRFNNSNAVAKKAKANVTDLEEEFTEYKKRALDREQKLRRQLQDEINKQRGV